MPKRVPCFHRAGALLAAFLLATAPAFAQQWELVWSDEFDAAGLPDTTRWGYDVGGHGWGNNEAQYYTEGRVENARVEDGVLVIEARKEPFAGNAYTSARLVSRDRGDWTYGRVEVMARLPSGRGTWPAIWMLPTTPGYGNGGWPDNGEIDIMEHVGLDPGRVHGSVHVNAYNHLNGNQKSASKTVPDVTSAFHQYAIEWTPRQIDFFIDDTLYFRYFNENQGWTAWPFDQPFHLLLNLAIGGNWGGQQGIDDSIFPQRLEVDYVRVYRNAAVPEVTLALPDTGAMLEPGAAIPFEAQASDSNGGVERVLFLQGDGIMGERTEAPYEWLVEDAQPGCYALSARVVDDQGWIGRSDTVHVTVGDGCTQSPYLIAPHAIPGVVEAEYFDLGGPGVGYFDLDAANKGGGIRLDEGVDIESTNDDGGGYHVGWVVRREWLAYTVHVAQAGRYTVEARVAAPTAGGSFQLEFDGVDKTGPVPFAATGDRLTWTTVRREGVQLDAGMQSIHLRFNDSDFSFNRLTFTLETATGRDDEGAQGETRLLPNFPDPFQQRTRIRYTVPRHAFVTLEVFNLLGQRVRTLVEQEQAPGRYEVTFDRDALPAGVYLYRLTTPPERHARTPTILR